MAGLATPAAATAAVAASKYFFITQPLGCGSMGGQTAPLEQSFTSAVLL
jgi:hypothetical protein